MNHLNILLLLVAVILAACSDPDQVPTTHASITPEVQSSGKQAERYPLGTALFGDLHVHTSWSADAYAGGNRLGPNTAYRFARGEAVELQNGVVAQLKTPLDFVALTDHAEGFATHLACTIPGEPEFDTELCRQIRTGDIDQQAMLEQAFETAGTRPAPRNAVLCQDVARCQANERATWSRVQDAANAFDDPGTFSALIGYEFSSLLEDFGMLHRNVVFRGADVIPRAISSIDVVNQADFFAQLDEACVEPCAVLTIPHNTNFSWGLAFSRTDEDGSAYSADDLERRARLDRLFEITQQKGNSECQLGIGFADEDCDFEPLFAPCAEGESTGCAAEQSFLRNALVTGLAMGAEQGTNPYKVGVIGSTDTHLSDPGNTAREIPAQFAPAADLSFAANTVMEREHVVIGPIRKISAGGLAGVWAKANTRADIFDALQRRETFGTSGSRMKIRFFAGEYPSDLGSQPDPVGIAYERGVPMGSDLTDLAAPSFWVWASQDPAGPTLDRVQVVKGWIEEGRERQKVWDVVCAGDRRPGSDGQCSNTTSTVDAETCTTSQGSGAAELQTTFSDPDYVAEQSAFYYIRVFENPTCRWTTVLANKAGVDRPDDVAASLQQRGWSSPIWVNSP